MLTAQITATTTTESKDELRARSKAVANIITLKTSQGFMNWETTFDGVVRSVWNAAEYEIEEEPTMSEDGFAMTVWSRCFAKHPSGKECDWRKLSAKASKQVWDVVRPTLRIQPMQMSDDRPNGLVAAVADWENRWKSVYASQS